MGLTKPDDTVMKITSRARWQRNWINKNRQINYSGLVQEMLIKLIEKNDPEYFQEHKKYLETRQTRRKETTKSLS